MLRREDVRQRILDHREGLLTLEDLSAWAERAFREESFDPAGADRIALVLSALRDATDPHRFRWEEPDFAALLAALEDV